MGIRISACRLLTYVDTAFPHRLGRVEQKVDAVSPSSRECMSTHILQPLIWLARSSTTISVFNGTAGLWAVCQGPVKPAWRQENPHRVVDPWLEFWIHDFEPSLARVCSRFVPRRLVLSFFSLGVVYWVDPCGRGSVRATCSDQNRGNGTSHASTSRSGSGIRR